MIDASARAREILDAIEHEARDRRDALAQERRALPNIVDVAHREPSDLVPGPQEVDALLAGAPVPAPARSVPAAAVPPTQEAARLLKLVDRVVDQAKLVQHRVEHLDAAVIELSERLGIKDTGPAGDTQEVQSVSTLRAGLPPAPSARVPAEPSTTELTAAAVALPADTRADGARIAGIEMAVAGYSRGEVEHRLARDYGLAAPQSILDDVFGAGSTRDSRMPWGGA